MPTMVNIPMIECDWWDNLKLQIRRTCIHFSSGKCKQLLSECNSLTKRLLRAKSAVFLSDRDQISNVNKLQSALEIVINNECEGAKIRSRARWFEEGEKPTRFFFRLQRKRAEKNIFESLFDESREEKFLHKTSSIEQLKTEKNQKVRPISIG